MAQLTVRNLADDVHAKIKARARRHGQSMEAEVREILSSVLVESEDTVGLGTRIASRFGECGLDTPIQELRGNEARPAIFDR